MKVKDETIVKLKAVTNTVVKKGYSPYIENGYWYEYDTETKQYYNTGIKATGENGADGKSITEAYINSNGELILEIN